MIATIKKKFFKAKYPFFAQKTSLSSLNENGKLDKVGKCLIFPSKEEDYWDRFYKSYLRSKYKLNHPMMFSMDGYEWTYGKYDLYKTCKIPYKNKKVTPSYMVPLEQFNFTNDYLIKNIEKSII